MAKHTHTTKAADRKSATKSKANGKDVTPAAREMPTGDEAERALRVLADLNDRVKRLERIEADKKDAYQTAKADREAATEALLAKLWQVTHAADLPLLMEITHRPTAGLSPNKAP